MMRKLMVGLIVVGLLVCSGCPATYTVREDKQLSLSEQVASYLHRGHTSRSIRLNYQRLNLLELDGIRLELIRLNDNLEKEREE